LQIQLEHHKNPLKVTTEAQRNNESSLKVGFEVVKQKMFSNLGAPPPEPVQQAMRTPSIHR